MNAKEDVNNTAGRLAFLWQEPVVVFVLLTVAIFAVDALRINTEPGNELEPLAVKPAELEALSVIRVSDSLKAKLEEQFFWLQGRQADAAESDRLVADWVKDEMIFRYALLENLHLGDSMVREQLIQKLRLLWAGMPDEPEQSEVLSYYMDNIARYYSEPQVSFTQVFFEQLPLNESSILEGLRGGEKIAGDGFWTGDEIRNYGESVMRTNFGGEFYNSLIESPLESWTGPIQSVRGYHYINLHAIQDSAPLAFNEIYDRVRSDLIGYEQSRRIDEQVAQIHSEFEVLIELSNE